MPFVSQKKLDNLICAAQVMHHWLHVTDRRREPNEIKGIRISMQRYKDAREDVFPNWNSPSERKIQRDLERLRKTGVLDVTR